MTRLIEWLGSIMFLVAILEFVPNPRKALSTITDTLAQSVRIEKNHLVLKKNARTNGIENRVK